MHQHIPKEIVEEYRESLKSEYASRQFHLKHPEFCERTMDYFERMGRFAENAATKDDLSQHMDTVEDILSRQTQSIAKHERRISDLDSRVGYIETLTTHTKLAVDANTAIAQQNLQLSQAISDRLDQSSKEKNQSASKKPNFAGIPNIGWIVIGVVSIMSIAAVTGTLTQFYGWLGTFKLFGGV